ncbi:hypothetical protein BVF91_06850, partial [Thermoanaerobacterium sp. PSU-2]
KLAVNGQKEVHFYGRAGGMVPEPMAILEEIKKIRGEKIMAVVFQKNKRTNRRTISLLSRLHARHSP